MGSVITQYTWKTQLPLHLYVNRCACCVCCFMFLCITGLKHCMCVMMIGMCVWANTLVHGREQKCVCLWVMTWARKVCVSTDVWVFVPGMVSPLTQGLLWYAEEEYLCWQGFHDYYCIFSWGTSNITLNMYVDPEERREDLERKRRRERESKTE